MRSNASSSSSSSSALLDVRHLPSERVVLQGDHCRRGRCCCCCRVACSGSCWPCAGHSRTTAAPLLILLRAALLHHAARRSIDEGVQLLHLCKEGVVVLLVRLHGGLVLLVRLHVRLHGGLVLVVRLHGELEHISCCQHITGPFSTPAITSSCAASWRRGGCPLGGLGGGQCLRRGVAGRAYVHSTHNDVVLEWQAGLQSSSCCRAAPAPAAAAATTATTASPCPQVVARAHHLGLVVIQHSLWRVWHMLPQPATHVTLPCIAAAATGAMAAAAAAGAIAAAAAGAIGPLLRPRGGLPAAILPLLVKGGL